METGLPVTPDPRLAAGFTLLETVMAVVLLGVAVLGLTYWQASIIRANTYAEQLTVAANLAQERMEELKLEPFVAVLLESPAPVPGYPPYTRWIEVTQISSTLKEVHVKVAWTMASGATREVELVTLVSGRD